MPHRTDNRRAFLRSMGLSTASMAAGAALFAARPSRENEARSAPVKPRGEEAGPAFSEVIGSLYAWDLHDEGIENILDNLQQMSAVNSVYLIALMHKEWQRPLHQKTYPHNPVRENYQMEDSRVYWHPDPKMYGRIKPRTSDRDWLKNTDWLKVLIEAARKRGMKTGVEISHTVIDSGRAENELSDCVQRDIHGNRLGKRVCFNSPDVREYVVGLFSDLTANYDVDYVQTCLFPFAGGARGPSGARRLLDIVARGGCFCGSCKRAAKEMGVDLGKIRAALLPIADSVTKPTEGQARELSRLAASNTSETAILLQIPELFEWLTFRCDSVTRFYKAIHDRVHTIRPAIDMRLNVCRKDHPEFSGQHLRALRPHLDSVRFMDYSEQAGKLSELDEKRRRLNFYRHGLGEDMPLFSAIGVRPKATADLVRRGVVVAAECGMDGITLGHYDGATFERLRAIREGLELAKVKIVGR